jgi:hypothetical protein
MEFTMSKMTRFLLVLSLSCLTAGLIFVTGIVNVGEAVGLYVTLPAGAIFFGLFSISLSLQAESALFDEEQRTIVAAIATATPASRKPCCEPRAQVKESLATARAS